MKNKLYSAFLLFWAALFLCSLIPVKVLADGTETLGPPGIAIATGTGIVAGGTGMVTQPGTITVVVPPGATIKQVLLYWDGQIQATTPVPDNTISVNGNSVIGTQIGGPAFFLQACPSVPPPCPGLQRVPVYNYTFRADITGLGLIVPGTNTLSVDDMDFNYVNNGAGILVIYDDGSPLSEIQMRDGIDLGFRDWPASELRTDTVPQTFTFAPSSFDRAAKLIFFAGSVEDDRLTVTTERPNSIEVTFGGLPPIVYSDYLQSFDGPYWDTLTLPLPLQDLIIPANTTNMTVQVISRADYLTPYPPASLDWGAAFLSLPVCGNGILDLREQCDDGNLDNGDGCSSTCKNEVCGNGILDPNEQCDDGNLDNGDGCSSTCKNEVCGNGIKDPNEQCDDGNLVNGDGCSSTCKNEVCGNGILDPNEQCDDGNLVNGDGCSSTCKNEVCGNGIKDPNEQCDDGNLVNGDGCSSTCKNEVCGNGILDPNEQCDDGNLVNGDGCSSICKTGCVTCKEGVQNMTLQLYWRTSLGDPNERIRVRVGSLTGAVLYDSWNDGNPNPGLPVGANFNFNVPLTAKQVVVTVQGKYHPSEYLKATFSAECCLVIGQISGNTYIKFKVVDAKFDGDKACIPPIIKLDVEKFVSIDGKTWLDADVAPGPKVSACTTQTQCNAGQVWFKFVVKNTGNTTLSSLTLGDNIYSTSGCLIPPSLAAGASFECKIGPKPPQVGQHTNTATATGIGSGLSAQDTDVANYYGEGCPPPPVCKACLGGVTKLTLKYNGTTTKYVMVKDTSGNILFSGTVTPGQSFTFIGKKSYSTMGSQIKIYVGTSSMYCYTLNTTVTTDCSTAIGPGLLKGLFTVVTGYSLTGGLLCPL